MPTGSISRTVFSTNDLFI